MNFWDVENSAKWKDSFDILSVHIFQTLCYTLHGGWSYASNIGFWTFFSTLSTKTKRIEPCVYTPFLSFSTFPLGCHVLLVNGRAWREMYFLCVHHSYFNKENTVLPNDFYMVWMLRYLWIRWLHTSKDVINKYRYNSLGETLLYITFDNQILITQIIDISDPHNN